MTRTSIVLPGILLSIDLLILSGVAGGVVQSTYFQIKFGVRPAEGPAKQSRIDDVSGNIVSALQGGAFFGALSSAPVSGVSRVPFPEVQLRWIVAMQMQTCFLHVTSSASAGTVPCERRLSSSSSVTNTADRSLAWIGRRKTLLAYTMIFAVGAVRYSRFVASLLGLC
jgi:hypothetical protein